MKLRTKGFSLFAFIIYCAISSIFSTCLLIVTSRIIVSLTAQLHKADEQTLFMAGIASWQSGIRSLPKEKKRWLLMNSSICIAEKNDVVEGYEIIKDALYFIRGTYTQNQGWIKKNKALVLEKLHNASFTFSLSRRVPQEVKAVILHATPGIQLLETQEWWSCPQEEVL